MVGTRELVAKAYGAQNLIRSSSMRKPFGQRYLSVVSGVSVTGLRAIVRDKNRATPRVVVRRTQAKYTTDTGVPCARRGVVAS